MEAGEKEMRLAFEEVVNRNVNSVIEYTKKTREMVRKLEKRIEKLESVIQNKDEEILQLRNQLAAVQTIVFSGGTVR